MSEHDDLTRNVQALPRAIAPPKDLWPEIAARLGEAEAEPDSAPGQTAQPTGIRFSPFALAAGLLLAVSVSFWLGRSQGTDSVSPTVTGTPAHPSSSMGAARPAARMPGAELEQTRQALVREIEHRLARLNPTTREVVVDNLAVINQALDDIDAALEAAPASDLDSRLLMAMYADQLVLLNTMNNALYPATPEVML